MKPTFITLLALCLCLGGCGKKKSPEPKSEVQKPGTVLWAFETGGVVESCTAIGSDGTVYVVEQGPGSGVSIWDIDGTLITRWYGNEGEGKDTILDGHGICVDSEGSIYVTEIGSGERVSKFKRV